jgi:hypothetical protein
MPATLWLDEQRRIDFCTPGNNDWSFEVDLDVKPYALRLEVAEIPLEATLRLSWSGPDQPMETPVGLPHVFTDIGLAREQARKVSAGR